MNMPNQSELQNDLNAIFEKIQEIAAKSEKDDYIYRGEPETHEEEPYFGKVSSSLWRECRNRLEGTTFNVEFVQKGMLDDAKKHIGDLPQALRASLLVFPDVDEEDTDETSDFETLTELQHYGGKTNLIDFTNDYFIALFFACDGHPDKDGRIILQKTEGIRDMIKYPRNPRHRVITQKSVFVRPPQGFIEPQEDDVVVIPVNLKQPMLNYLRKYHDISTETIYNDLHGFIRNQSIHQEAYIELYIGLSHDFKGDSENDNRTKRDHYDKAIKHYDKAIKLKTSFVIAYYKRGHAYYKKDNYNRTIRDLNKVIALYPDFAMAYNLRGVAYYRKGDYDSAITDLNKAIVLNPDLLASYNNRGKAYLQKGDYDSAIADLNKAIALKSDYGRAYYNRGLAWLHLQEWHDAKLDLTTAKNRGENLIELFRDDYRSVAVFQAEYEFQLPPDIAAMLKPPRK